MHLTPSNVTIFAPKPIPLRVGTPELWLDAADSNTITLDGSSNVEQWRDKSGNVRHAEQATTLARPSLSTINGVQALLFDGTDDSMESTFSSISQPLMIYSVFRQQIITVARVVYDSRLTAACALFSNTANIVAEAGATLTWTSGAALNTGVATTVIYNGASSSIRSNGVEKQTGNAGTNALTSGMKIGVSRASSARFFGQIGEILVYSAVHDSTQLSQVEGYLMSKWRIA
jgi:hypothetical protein